MKALKHWLISLAAWWGFGTATTTATNFYVASENGELIALTCMALPVVVYLLFEVTLGAGAVVELLRYIITLPLRLLGLVGKYRAVGVSPHRLGLLAVVVSSLTYAVAGWVVGFFVEAEVVLIYTFWGLLWGGGMYYAFRHGYVTLNDFMEE